MVCLFKQVHSVRYKKKQQMNPAVFRVKKKTHTKKEKMLNQTPSPHWLGPDYIVLSYWPVGDFVGGWWGDNLYSMANPLLEV